LSLRREGFVPHTRHPNSWGLYQRDKPPKCLAVKTKVYFQENHYKYRTENPLLKGLCTDSLATLRPQGKCNNSKGKGDSFANLKNISIYVQLILWSLQGSGTI